MATFPESGVKLVADLSQYTDAMQSAIDLANEFDAIGSISIDVSANVDTSNVETDLSDIPDQEVTVTPAVDTTAVESDLADIPDQDIAVNVKETDTAKETLSAVQTLKNMKIIETVWNIAGTGVDLIQKFGGQALDPILKLGEAVAEVGAKTGGAIPNADKLINKIFYDDLGKSKEEVGKMIIAAHGLGLPIEDATRAALTFTHTWSDVDSTQAITSFGTLLKTNLVGNMQEASDLMTVFFQNGGNKAGDALQVVNANAQSWHDMGLTASEALSTITTLLNGNVDSASDAAKMIQTLDDNLTTAASNAKSPQADMLKTMGLVNPKDTGKAMGADFISGFAAAFTNLPADQQDLASGLFMGKGGKKFTGAIEGMTPDSDMFKNVKDQAAIAAKEVDNSLHGSIDDFILVANEKLEGFLSSEAIDLPGKINALKQGLQDGMDVLAQGGDLGQALTVALKPIGFDDEFQGLESMLGNFVIALLQIVSSLQSLSPDNWEAKKGTDALIAKQGATQLAFDLKIANPDEVATDISTATSRGLSSTQIADTVSGVIDQLIKDGTSDSLAKAQQLVDTLNKPIDMNKVPTLASGAPMNVEPTVTPEGIAALQTKLDAAKPVTVEAVPSTASTDAFLDNIMPITTATTNLNVASDATAPSVQANADATKAQGDNAKVAQTTVQNTATATKTLGDNAKSASPEVASVSGELNAISAIAPLAASGLQSIWEKIGQIVAQAGQLSQANDTKASKSDTSAETVPAHAGGTDNATGTFMTGENGPELVTSNQSLAVLNNKSTNAIMAALQGFIPGGSVSKSGSSSFTAINNNIVQSEAQADAVGYRTATQLRGMASN